MFCVVGGSQQYALPFHQSEKYENIKYFAADGLRAFPRLILLQHEIIPRSVREDTYYKYPMVRVTRMYYVE